MSHATDLIPPRPAPQSSNGIIGRVQALAAQGPSHLILSVISYAAMAAMIWLILRWAISPTWNAQSLAECRDILDGQHGKACWGVINERWSQLLIGFYPKTQFWRPALAFVLLGLAISAMLRANARAAERKLAVIPFVLTPYLLWGGPIWSWVVLFGAACLLLVMNKLLRSTNAKADFAIRIAFIGAAVWLAMNISDALPANLKELGLEPVKSREFGGFLLSFLIGLTAILFSLPMGVALALGRTSKLPLLRVVSTGFIEFIRGVPLITLLFIASTLLNIFLPPGTNFDIIVRVIIMVTLFASAYIAEIVRGALAAVPKGQTEGAASLGLNYWQTQRLIILPQALKISIPGIVSTFIAVFKDTTLVSIIGLLDPLGLANNIRADSAWTGIVWEIYGFAALIFFIFCFAMSQYSMWLERQLQTGHR